ncbi:hypothetical protein Zmor_023786 [Zophobas morio]|uniref:Regulatory protein zeste n=1 Tax=Zophobas morio TaxID=2755281 RepID=A0AA38HZ56_9CUCU|nr:hypothetical protein Zmor_023786 [Zophobas morio]
MSNTRAPNFTKSEENLLLSLVSKYKNILECKLSNTDANQKKNQCWKKIEVEFNFLSGQTFRDHKVLKKKYDNIKKRTTKKFADEKAYVGGTGGGSQQSIEVTDVDVAVKEILGARLMGDSSEFDGDSETTSFQSNGGINVGCLITTPAHLEEQCTSMYNLSDDENDDCFMPKDQTGAMSREVPVMDKISCPNKESENGQTGNWAKYTPKMLKQKKSSALTPYHRGKGNQTSDKLEQWATAKELVELS